MTPPGPGAPAHEHPSRSAPRPCWPVSLVFGSHLGLSQLGKLQVGLRAALPLMVRTVVTAAAARGAAVHPLLLHQLILIGLLFWELLLLCRYRWLLLLVGHLLLLLLLVHWGQHIQLMPPPEQRIENSAWSSNVSSSVAQC